MPQGSPRGTYLEVSESLREKIREGTISEALPSQSALVSEYRVSRSTIERALAALKADGVVESVQGAGWFVAGTGDRRPLIERVTDLLRGEGVKVGDRFPHREGAVRALRSVADCCPFRHRADGGARAHRQGCRARTGSTCVAGRPGDSDRMTMTERTEFDADSAGAILRKACEIVGVDPDGIEMLRFGDHAVFRMDGGRIVSRVGRSPDRLTSVRREVAVAEWLAAEQYPAARLVTAAEQPVVVEGHPVTFWEGLADGDTYASTGEMGVLLRRLHDLDAPSFSLPPLQPFDKVTQRLTRAVIPDTTRAYLRSMADDLAAEYGRLRFVLPAGHLHGDFNVGNVLRDAASRPRVIDLDGFVTGPREWDLMQTAMYYDSFGWHTEAEYADFVAGYGFDVREWSGYSVLRSIRELLMVTWLSQNAGTNPRAAEEVEKRVESLRSGGSRRDWAPF